jgi:transposase
MSTTKYTIKLTDEERIQLRTVATGKKGRLNIAAWKVTRAKALLKIDRGEQGPAWTDKKAAEALEVSERSITNWKKKAFHEGPMAVLQRKQRVVPPTKVDGRVEAHLTKLACSQPPEGRSKWTLRLLANRVVELEIVDSLSHESVRRALKKRLETVASPDVVYPAGSGRTIRGSDGTGAGGLRSAVR